jgi:hypothetical protein
MSSFSPIHWLVFLMAAPVMTAPIWVSALLIRYVVRERRKAKEQAAERLKAKIME